MLSHKLANDQLPSLATGLCSTLVLFYASGVPPLSSSSACDCARTSNFFRGALLQIWEPEQSFTTTGWSDLRALWDGDTKKSLSQLRSLGPPNPLPRPHIARVGPLHAAGHQRPTTSPPTLCPKIMALRPTLQLNPCSTPKYLENSVPSSNYPQLSIVNHLRGLHWSA